MKAIWIDPGDPSVGLMGGSYEIDLGDWAPEDEHHRQTVREAVNELHTALWGEAGNVYFSDECTDCAQPMEGIQGDKLVCVNKGCVNSPLSYQQDEV